MIKERYARGTQLKPIKFSNIEVAKVASSILCSSTFFLWWLSLSDCYHLNKPEVVNFNYDIIDNKATRMLISLYEILKSDLLLKSERRVYNYKISGRVENDEFYMKKSKTILDEIDKVLANHYGFTEEELDFIINYDIKYRMGKELESEDEE